MADREELMKLAERCEAASGPDRELDAVIAVALDLRPDWLRNADGEMWVSNGRLSNGEPVIRWRDSRMKRSPGNPPAGEYAAYTASLDAAMLLVPEGWCLETLREWPLPETEGRPWFAELRPRKFGDERREFALDATTSALALAAASLRARANGGGE